MTSTNGGGGSGVCACACGRGVSHSIVTCLEDCDVRLANRRLHQQNTSLRRRLQEAIAAAARSTTPGAAVGGSNDGNDGALDATGGGGGNGAGIANVSYIQLLNDAGGTGGSIQHESGHGEAGSRDGRSADPGGKGGRGGRGGNGGNGEPSEADAAAAAAARLAAAVASRKAKEEMQATRQQNLLLHREFEAANNRIDKLLEMQKSLSKKYERELKARRAASDNAATLTTANVKAEAQIKAVHAELSRTKKLLHHQQKQTKKAQKAAGIVTGGGGGGGSPVKNRGFVMHTLQIKLDKAKSKIEKLISEKEAMKEATMDLAAAHKQAQGELGALDHTFFEELEDLKYALQQSNKLNGALDAALRRAALDAGVPYQSLLPDLAAVLGASFRHARGIGIGSSTISSGGGGRPW